MHEPSNWRRNKVFSGVQLRWLRPHLVGGSPAGHHRPLAVVVRGAVVAILVVILHLFILFFISLVCQVLQHGALLVPQAGPLAIIVVRITLMSEMVYSIVSIIHNIFITIGDFEKNDC